MLGLKALVLAAAALCASADLRATTALDAASGDARDLAVSDPCSTKYCQFQGADSSDCVVLGKIDGTLIDYPSCSASCLTALNIKVQAVDPVTLKQMFPTADGLNANLNAVINFLKFGSSSVTQSIKAGFPAFFTDPLNTGTLKLKDTVNGVTCKNNETGCYAEFKKYLATSQGAKELSQVGQTLYNSAANALELQQSTCRIRLCANDLDDASAAKGVCSSPYSYVGNLKAGTYSGKACSAFGFGPGTSGCSTSTYSTKASGIGSNGAAAAYSLTGYLQVVACALAMLAL